MGVSCIAAIIQICSILHGWGTECLSIQRFGASTIWTQNIQFSEDGKYVACQTSDFQICVWTTNDLKLQRVINAPATDEQAPSFNFIPPNYILSYDFERIDGKPAIV